MSIRFGHYDVHIRLGRGGGGNVFLARDVDDFGSLVALKLLQPDLRGDPSRVREFWTEAKICGQLHHPNIVRTHEVENIDGILALPMEFVHGMSLRELLRFAARNETSLTVGTILSMSAQLCAGLHHAHERCSEGGWNLGIVHRDVTPENIMVGFDGLLQLTDFGTATALDRGWSTSHGVIKGKARYIAPERINGGPIDRRVDLFSLGVVLWEAATGCRLFSGSRPAQVLLAIRDSSIPPPSQFVPGLPPCVDAFFLRALARDPRDRFQTAEEMAISALSLLSRARAPHSHAAISDELLRLLGDEVVQREAAVARVGIIDDEELAFVMGGSVPKPDELLTSEEQESSDIPRLAATPGLFLAAEESA